MRSGLVEKIAEDVEDVEQYLMYGINIKGTRVVSGVFSRGSGVRHRTEEYMAAQNAVFVTQQVLLPTHLLATTSLMVNVIPVGTRAGSV
jgi:hypothetical protein